MTNKARFTQGQITKLLKGAKGAGMVVTRITVAEDGSITLDFGDEQATPGPNEWDEVFENPLPLPRKR
jgi:hypothetical protein